jgi:phthalate 4,5-cis-dihydrodiol dehydrogenase
MAAENGKHVIVEKPMATSVQECDSIIESVGRNGVVLVYGHTHAYDPPIQAISELVGKAKYGRMTMFNSWNFTDLMVRPRDPWELDVTHGGGIAFIHAPHQIDIAREIGGPISQVHARTGGSLPDRPTEGHYIAYFEYDSGIPGTLVSSSYGYFDTSELHYWADESGRQRGRDASKDSWGRYRERRSPSDEARAREGRRYGAAEGGRRARRRAQPFFGLTVVSCERADLRQSRRGLWIYDSKGRTEVTLPLYPTGRQLMIDELAAAIAGRSPVVHDGEWGRATVAACLAIRQSAKAGNPVSMRGEAREAAAVLSANTGSEP